MVRYELIDLCDGTGRQWLTDGKDFGIDPDTIPELVKPLPINQLTGLDDRMAPAPKIFRSGDTFIIGPEHGEPIITAAQTYGTHGITGPGWIGHGRWPDLDPYAAAAADAAYLHGRTFTVSVCCQCVRGGSGYIRGYIDLEPDNRRLQVEYHFAPNDSLK